MVRGQQFTKLVETTNMADCISSLETLLNTSKDDIYGQVSLQLISSCVIVSAIVGGPDSSVVLTAVDVPGVHAVARVAVAAIPNAVDIPSAGGFSNVSGVPAVVSVPAVAASLLW